MADLRFFCPVCRQKILVDDGAAGVSLDCPACQSILIVPPNAVSEVIILEKKTPPTVGAGAESVVQQLSKKKRELEVAKAEMANLKSDLDAVRSQLEKSRIEMTAAKAGEDQVREKLLKAEGDVKRLSEELAKVREAQAAAVDPKPLQERIAALEAEVKSAREEAVRGKGELEQKTAALCAAAEQAEAAKKELHTLQEEIQQLKATSENQAKKLRELGESFAGSERERVELLRKLAQSDASKELLDLREKLAVAQTQVSSVQASLQTMRTERDRVRHQLAEREAQGARAAELEQALKDAHAGREAAEEATRNAEAAAKKIGEELAEAKNLIKAESGEIAKLKTQLEVQTLRANSANDRNDGLESELARRVGELGSLRHDVNRATEREALARQEVAQRDEQIAALRAELAALRETLSSPEKGDASAAKAAEELKSAAGRLRAAELERDQLREEVEALSDGLERSKQHIESLQERREEMRMQISELKGKLESESSAPANVAA
jgi:chromosome segregation ATPase